MNRLVNSMEQGENLVEPSHLDGSDHWTSVIDDDVQWLTQLPGGAGGVDQGLQTRRAQKCHLGQIDHESRPFRKLVEPGCNRCTESVDGEHIDLSGYRQHECLGPGMHHPAALDPYHLLGARTHASAGIANPCLLHLRTISVRGTVRPGHSTAGCRPDERLHRVTPAWPVGAAPRINGG